MPTGTSFFLPSVPWIDPSLAPSQIYQYRMTLHYCLISPLLDYWKGLVLNTDPPPQLALYATPLFRICVTLERGQMRGGLAPHFYEGGFNKSS